RAGALFAVAGAVELLDGARQILTFGAGGSSTMLTQQLQFRLVRLGYAISAYPQSLLPRMVASSLEPSDVVLPVVARETDFIYHPSASRYAMLAAIDVLALELALRHQDRSRTKLRRLKITLDAHRGGDNRQPLGD
ncbi:MAG: transcriptional regulator, partial [Pseudomonadota bacterium]|nr:transcriptional regulator [Pseudomonadota bacterium]